MVAENQCSANRHYSMRFDQVVSRSVDGVKKHGFS